MKRDSLRCIKSINFENKVKNLAVLIFIVISFSGLNIVSLKESDVNNNEFSNETKNKLFIEESIPKVADISEEQPFEQQITIYNASQFDVSENVYYLSNTQDLAINDENLTFGIPENWESSQAIIDVSSLYQESEIFEDGNMNGNFTGTINPWQTKTNYPYSGIPSIPSANFNYHNYASEDYANITFYEPYNYNSLYGFYENSNSTFNKEDKEVEIGELYESERQVFPILNGFSSDPFYPSGEYVKLDNGDIYSNNTDKMVSTVSVDHLSGISAIRNQILTADSQLDRRRGDPSVASGLNFFVPFEADKITVTFCWAVENNQYSYLDGFKVKASINNQFIDGRYDENGQLYSSSDIEGDFNSLEVDNEPGEENNHVWETRSYNITELVGDFGYRKGWHSLDFGCYMEHPEYLGGDVNVYWDYVIINVTHYDWYKAAELDFDYLLEDLGFFNDKYFFDSKSFVIYFGDGDGDTDNLYRYYINETSDLPEASGWLNRINQEIVIPHTYMEAFQVNNFTFKVGLESNRKDYYIPGGMSLMTNFEKRLSIDNFSLNINFKIINDEDFTDIDLNAKINTDPWIDIPNLNQNWCSINFGPPNLNISFRINSSSYSTVPEPRMRFSAAIKARKFTENVSESSVILNDISQSYCIWNTTFNTTDSINEISNDSSIFSNNLYYYYNFTIENLPAFDGLGTSSQDWNIKELYCPLNQNLTTAIIKSSSYPFLQNVSAISGTYLYNEYLVNGTWTFLAEQTNYMTNGTIYHIDYTPIEKFYNGNDTFFDLNVRNSTDINGNYNVTIFNSSIYAVNTSYYGNDADENRTINWKVIDTGVGIYRLFTTWNDTNSDNQTKRFGWYTDNFEIWRKTTCRIHPTEKEQEIGSIFDYEIEFNYSINGLSNAIENASLSAYNNETGNEWGKDWIPTYDFVSYTQSGDNYSIYLETISIPSGDYKVRFLLEKDYYDMINWTDCVWVKIVGVLSNFTIEFLSGVHENPSGSEDLTLDLSNIPYVNDSSTSIIQINVTNSSSNREKIRDAIITGKFNGSDTIMIGYEQYQYPYDEQDKGIYNLVLNTTGLNHTDQINFKNYTLEISIGRTNFTSVINTTSVYIKKLPLIIEEESISNIYEGESIEIQATVSKNNTGVLNPCYSASVFYSLFNSTDDSYLFGGLLENSISNVYSVQLTDEEYYLLPGEYYIKVNASGFNFENHTGEGINFTVLKKNTTTISLIIEEVRIGGTFAVTAELVYVYNSTVSNPIANQTILLTLNYSEPFQVLLETGENGRGSYEMYINEYHTGKTFTTEANFTGTEIYLPCYQIEESIILGKYEVNLTIENPPSAVQVGYNATYIMNISIEENENAERLIYLSAFYDDETLAFLTRELYSDSNGTILYTFDEILNNHNNITIYFEFLGTAQIKSSLVNFTSQIIPKWNSSILIENLPEEIRRGQTIVINLTLFSEDFGFSESFAGEPINFIFNFSNVVVEIYTYYLDENASIILEYIIPESEVTMFNISVSYLGTNKILECEVNSDKIILPKKDTGLVIETFFGEQVFSGTYYCSANLTDENNNPLANVNITFQLFNSKQELIGTFSGVTGINGYVSVTIELLEAGDYTILAIFEGESIYAANESLAFNVHVVTPISLFIENLPFILLITVLIVFGNLVLYRTVLLPRKNRRLEELKAIHQRFSDAENIQYILILTQGGLSLFSKSFTKIPIDETLVSGFLTAISSFGAEIGGKIKDGKSSNKGLEQLSYQQFKIIVNDATLCRTAILLLEDASPVLKSKLKRFNYRFQEKYMDILENFNGQLPPEEPILELIEQYLDVDLLYPHNLNMGRVNEYMKTAEKSIEKLVLEESQKPKFNNSFKIRPMMNHLRGLGKKDIMIFNGIDHLRKTGIAFAINSRTQFLINKFKPIIENIPEDARILLIKILEGTTSETKLRKIKNITHFEENLQLLKDMQLIDENFVLTEYGEVIATILKLIPDI